MRFWIAFWCVSLPLAAQQTMPEPRIDDNTGFEAIFDGKTLNGWDGDPEYWRVEEGALVGEVTPETILKSNTFIIWRAALPKILN